MCQIEMDHCAYTYQPCGINAYQALFDINIKIQQGELVAIIGHGGSGKSTLAFLLAGLFSPQDGSVRIDGSIAPDKDIFSQVSLVFQYPEQQLFAESVFEEIAFGARNFGVAEDRLPLRVRKALNAVGLDPELYWHRSPFTLSGGEKRRVCLGAMLAMDPHIVILDEPTAGLDEGGRRWIKELIASLNKEGKTVIWISHDMAEVAELARRVIVMEKGRTIMDGTPESVFACETRLREAGLDIPKAAALVYGLKNRGLEIPGHAITVETAFAEIRDYLEGRRHV